MNNQYGEIRRHLNHAAPTDPLTLFVMRRLSQNTHVGAVSALMAITNIAIGSQTPFAIPNGDFILEVVLELSKFNGAHEHPSVYLSRLRNIFDDAKFYQAAGHIPCPLYNEQIWESFRIWKAYVELTRVLVRMPQLEKEKSERLLSEFAEAFATKFTKVLTENNLEQDDPTAILRMFGSFQRFKDWTLRILQGYEVNAGVKNDNQLDVAQVRTAISMHAAGGHRREETTRR
jgi:hypothetical protein